ncbi:MAG: toprim domain-containing protein, partial [Oscillospiraceae bacterium]|nr:toprim domain-containing protein [Oscillospiraceae bacterium]
EQARLMSRYTKEVIIAYDSDGAGQKAAQRAIGILERLDLKVRVLRMTGAKDPDEFIRMKGADAFANLLKDSENQVDYRLNTVKAKYDLSLDDQKVSYLKEASELLASLPGQVERQVYAIRVADEASIGQDAVIREVERRRKILLSRLKKDYERDITRPEKAVQPAERTMRYSNPGAAAAEEGIIRLLYLEPALVREELPDAKEFSSEALGKIYSVIKAAIESGTSVSVNALAPKLAQEEMNLLVRIIQKPERLSESRSILADYVRRMREEQDRKGGSEDLKALSEKLRKEKGFRP